VNHGHGRIEIRRIAVRTVPDRLDTIWKDATRVVRIERLRETKTFCTRQVIYAITSIPPGMMDEAGLLARARDHWQIESAPQSRTRRRFMMN
jgi:hypothetical protein